MERKSYKHNPSEGIHETAMFSEKLEEYTFDVFSPSAAFDEQKNAIIEELVPLTAEGFLKKDSEELKEDVNTHVLSSDRLVIARYDKKTIGYAISSIIPVNTKDTVYHLSGIMIANDYQGIGLSNKLLQDQLVDTDATLLGFHTQSKKMLKLGQKIADLNLEDSEKYAHAIGTKNLQKNSSGEIIDKNRYGGVSLYGNLEEFSPNAITVINWKEGDALVCIGPIKRKETTIYDIRNSTSRR